MTYNDPDSYDWAHWQRARDTQPDLPVQKIAYPPRPARQRYSSAYQRRDRRRFRAFLIVLAVLIVAIVAGEALWTMAVAVTHHLEHQETPALSPIMIRVNEAWYSCGLTGNATYRCAPAPYGG